jgi:hypothetical protein
MTAPVAGTYTFSAWVYIPSSGGFNTLIPGVGSGTFTSGAPITQRNQWVHVSLTAPVVAGNGSFYLYDYTGSGTESSSNVFYATQFMMTAGPTTYNYADGASAGWTWNGSANNSTSSGPQI